MRTHALSFPYFLIIVFLWINTIHPVSGKNKGEKIFIHPGMAQSREDLEYMKQNIHAENEPWSAAFEVLKEKTSLDFTPQPFTCISVGPYGANNIGGKEFAESAGAVYNHALMWYITENKKYADKAVEILNAWSYRLWDLDANNAKLNIGLFGADFLQAAEILKYTYSGWEKQDMEQFKRMVLTVFYPTIRDFFTEANGNWDASMIHTLLCIAIYTDNPDIFDLAIERYYRGTGNSGITRYIYPTGQCQETTRDWDHVQLGLGEFAKAAQTAWTQGVDLYSAADNRLARGYEYASAFLLGEPVPVFGVLSQRDKEKIKDIYESIWDHYKHVKSIELINTGKMRDQYTRPYASGSILTGLRKPRNKHGENTTPANFLPPFISPYSTGALEKAVHTPPANSIRVKPGESIQKIINNSDSSSPVWIVLEEGVHTLKESIVLKNNITLSGHGIGTVLFLSPERQEPVLINHTNETGNIAVFDLLIEGAVNIKTNDDPNHDRRTRSYMNAPVREGIVFAAEKEGRLKNIRIENVTVQNCTRSGIVIKGAENITIRSCDISDNGSSMVPGAGFHHNLKLMHVSTGKIAGSRFDTSPWGNGIDMLFCTDITVEGNELARNKLSGIRCAESSRLILKNNLSEGNDQNGIFLEALMNGNKYIQITDNQIQNNGQYGIHIEKSFETSAGKNVLKENKYEYFKEPEIIPDPEHPDYAEFPMEKWEKPFSEFGFFTYNSGDIILPYRLFKPTKIRSDKKLPLVLFMHGMGERGNDNRKQFFRFRTYPFWEKYPCYVLAPQCPEKASSPDKRDNVWVNTSYSAPAHSMEEQPVQILQLAMELLDSILIRHNIDTNRIYVTGLSMGGFATWELLQRLPGKFAAAIPVCGGGDPVYASEIAHTSLWVIHGDADLTVPVERSRNMVKAIKESKGNPRYTEYPGVGHDSWTQTYSRPEIWEWLFSQKK